VGKFKSSRPQFLHERLIVNKLIFSSQKLQIKSRKCNVVKLAGFLALGSHPAKNGFCVFQKNSDIVADSPAPLFEEQAQ
jgi:hypothetical protein